MSITKQSINSTSSQRELDPLAYQSELMNENNDLPIGKALSNEESLLLDDDDGEENGDGQGHGESQGRENRDIRMDKVTELPELKFGQYNPQNCIDKFEFQSRTQLTLQLQVQQLLQQSQHYQQKYKTYKALSIKQEQIITRMIEEVKKSRQELNGYKLSTKAKLEAYLQVKDIEIQRLREDLGRKDRLIADLEGRVKRRSQLSGITIEEIEDQGKGYSGEQVRKLEQLVCEQERLLEDNSGKIEKLTYQICELSATTIRQQSEIASLTSTLKILKHEHAKTMQENQKYAAKNQKMAQMMAKQQEKIRKLGILILELTSQDQRKPAGKQHGQYHFGSESTVRIQN